MKPVVRRTLLWLAGLAAFAVCGAAVLFGVALFALRAGPGDWSQRVSLGPVGMDISVPALARVASHPLGMRLLAGRSAATRYGRIGVAAGTEPGTLVVTCAPCVVGNASLAARPIRLAAVEFTVAAGEPNQLLGTIRVGVVRANWQVRLGARDARLEVDIADAALADLVALFGDAVPEAAVARIGGRGGAAIRVALPSGRYSVRPRLDGVVVAGLGTDVLAGATPAPSCGRTPRAQRSASPYGTWLARAVIAAEDQRFYEHAGYDTAEMAAAWSTEAPHAERRRGASTLSQQLAKLLYTGDDRTLARKIRELLYAVELDRTLGKARVLQLYLAVAPWGDGVCGGEAAALHYFGRHAASLGPAEAVWLAGLLRNPELELTRGAQGAPADNGRLVVIGESIRPISRQRRTDLREQLERMVPPPPVLARAEAPAAGTLTVARAPAR